MITHDVTHKDNSRSMQIRTPCGFEITLMRNVEGELKQACYYNGFPVCLMNSHYKLSREGANIYADAMKVIMS